MLYRYILVNLSGAVVAVSIMVNDERIASFLVLQLFGVWSAFVDAMPSGMRRVTCIRGLGVAVFCFVVIQFGLFFKLIIITDVTYALGGITFTCSNLATSCITNLVFFWTRNVITAILHPTSMTVIKSLVKSEKTSKIEAKVLYAAFHLKEAARYLKEKKEVEKG
jgi:hypothetical protein